MIDGSGGEAAAAKRVPRDDVSGAQRPLEK
jgi:hypothetical protein